MPIGFPLALPLGGGPDDVEVEQGALLDALRAGLDPSDPIQIAITSGEALTVAMIWAVDERLKGQLDPRRMLETLPQWEQACGLRPAPTDTDNARRAAVLAQFLGIVGNAISQLYAICVAIAGAQFLGFYVPQAAAPTYTPGVSPGPPGWESTSTRAIIGVRLSPVALASADFLDLVRRLTRALAQACPSWMDFTIGTDAGGFVVDVAVADLTLVLDA